MRTSVTSRRPFASVLVVAALLAAVISSTGPRAAFADEHRDPLPVRSSVSGVGELMPDVRIHGRGWGHGVGMSQYGAYAQARAGRTVDDILGFYFPGTELRDDTRSQRRIRVSILDDVSSTTIEAVDGPVEWLRCSPGDGESIGGRVSDCDEEPWFTQGQGTTLIVCPIQESPPEPDDALQGTEPGPAPITGGELRSGIRVVGPFDFQADGCAGDALHETLDHQVARVDHHGTTIRTAAHGSTTRLYRHGWRDLHSRSNGTVLDSVQDVPSVEAYLYGLAEVPSSWGREGPGALRAQAVTGRTFAVGRLGLAAGCACDIRATPADQNYTGYSKEAAADGDLWVAAVDATAGRVLTFDGGLAQTFYSSSHGGRSENVEESWAFGTTPIPYLRSRDDPWSIDPDVNNPYASWTAAAANTVMADLLSGGAAPDIERVERLAVRSRTEGGTPRELEATGSTADGQRITFTTDLRDSYAKGIAGAAMRRHLALVDGAVGTRLPGSQIQRFGFAPFVDDDGSVHEYAITWAAEAGVVRGVSDTSFAPNRPVTRAQMATFLVNTFEVLVDEPSGVFTDVGVGDTHAANIEALTAAGIARGYQDGSFRPDERVTRAQMATFLAGALALSTDTTGTFTDVPGDGTHDASIEAIAEAGVTSGCGGGRFCPAEAVQRGQLASFVMQAVGS